jgi:hypothetical protein
MFLPGQCAPIEGRFHPDSCRWVRKLASGSVGQAAGSEPRDKGRVGRLSDPAGRNVCEAEQVSIVTMRMEAAGGVALDDVAKKTRPSGYVQGHPRSRTRCVVDLPLRHPWRCNRARQKLGNGLWLSARKSAIRAADSRISDTCWISGSVSTEGKSHVSPKHDEEDDPSPIPSASLICLLPSDEVWSQSVKVGQPPHGGFLPTDEIYEMVARILGRRFAELQARRLLPSEGRMRDELQTLRDALQFGFLDIVKLTPHTKRPVQLALRKLLHKPVESWYNQVERVMSILDHPEEFVACPELREIALAAVQSALDESNLRATPGPDPSPLKPALVDLACAYVLGGGIVTQGNSESNSPFAQWAFVLLSCGPKEIGGFSLEQINNLVKGMNWDTIPRPVHACF